MNDFYLVFSAHGSAASLISGGSSLYGSAEERQANEVRRLKRELGDAREQVNSLSNQLSLHVSTLRFKKFIQIQSRVFLSMYVPMPRLKNFSRWSI